MISQLLYVVHMLSASSGKYMKTSQERVDYKNIKSNNSGLGFVKLISEKNEKKKERTGLIRRGG